jgi:TonB family protein
VSGPSLFDRSPLVDPAPDRSPWAGLAVSVAVHAVLVMLLVAQAIRFDDRLPEPEQEPDVALSFQEPRPALEIPFPEAPAPPPRPAPAPSPAPPPAAAPQQAPPPAIPPDAPLLGWNGKQGNEPGKALRPPGPEGPVHAPPPPGGGAAATPQDAVPEPPATAAEQVDPERPPAAPAMETPPGLERGADGEVAPARPAEDRPSTPRAENPTVPRRFEVPDRPRPGEGSGGTGRGKGTGPGAGPDFNQKITGGLFGDLHFDSGDYNWSDYTTKVYFAVYRAWLRELLGRARRFERDQNLLRLPDLDGVVAIHFVLTRAGPVEAVEIVRPSPIPTLDEASAAALRRAVMPPLPADFPRDREGVTFTFRISGFETATQLERQLEWAQANGEF